ncbi:MAG: hypothetical protein LBP58_07900 [Azoarcus sp.]|nr:hypothetical protein [Azoarcus sp.]
MAHSENNEFRAFLVQMPTQSEAGMFFVIPRKRSIAACLAVTHRQAPPRHCEGRRPVAIQKAVQIVSAIQKIEAPYGLPRRCVPRDDECHHLNRKRSSQQIVAEQNRLQERTNHHHE